MKTSSLMELLSWNVVQDKSGYYEMVEMVNRYKSDYYTGLYHQGVYFSEYWDSKLYGIMLQNGDLEKLNDYVQKYNLTNIVRRIFDNPEHALNPKNRIGDWLR